MLLFYVILCIISYSQFYSELAQSALRIKAEFYVLAACCTVTKANQVFVACFAKHKKSDKKICNFQITIAQKKFILPSPTPLFRCFQFSVFIFPFHLQNNFPREFRFFFHCSIIFLSCVGWWIMGRKHLS